MTQPSLFDQFEPAGGRRGRCKGDFPKLSPYTGARAYAQGREFAETPTRTAPTAPCDDVPDPASASPTKAALAEWDREYLAWQEAGCPGGPDAWPRPPAGWSRMGRLIPRTNRSYRTWR